MTARGMLAYASQSKLSPAEEAAWQRYRREQPHACRTMVDWADLYATMNNLKRRLMHRNATPTRESDLRRWRIRQHV